jgi:transposase
VSAGVNRWSPEDLETLKDLRCVKGWSCKAIGSLLGRSENSVVRKLQALEWKLPPEAKQGKPLFNNPEAEPFLREAFAHGSNVKQTAKRVGSDSKTVRNAFARFGQELQLNATAFVPMGGFIGSKEMVRIVSPICGATPQAILSGSRYRPPVLARMAIARALRDRGVSLSVIAKAIGRGDHSTVHNLLGKFDGYARLYPTLGKAYEAIKHAEAQAAERMAA